MTRRHHSRVTEPTVSRQLLFVVIAIVVTLSVWTRAYRHWGETPYSAPERPAGIEAVH